MSDEINNQRKPRPVLPFRRRPAGPLPGQTEQYRGRPHHVLISAVLLTVILSVIMVAPILPGQVDIQERQPATQDIFAPDNLRYESEILTSRARLQIMADPSNEVWVQNTDLVQRQQSLLTDNLRVIDALRSYEISDPPGQRPDASNLQGMTLTKTLLNMVLALSDGEYNYWRNSAVLPTFNSFMKEGRLASEADVEAARSGLNDRLPPTLSVDQKAAAVAFISPLLTPNIRLDEEATRLRREASAATVKPVVQTVQKGEAILRQGELATPEAIEKMQKAGLLSKDLSLQSVVGTVSIVSLLMILLHLYIFRYAVPVWRRHKQLLLVGMLMVVTIAVARVFLPGHALLPYVLPVAAVSMLIAVLLSTNLAVMVTFVLSVLLGIVVSNGLSMDLPVYYFVSGLTGIFSLTRIEKVSTFARAGIYMAVASFLAALALKVLEGHVIIWSDVGTLGLAAAFSAGMATSVTYVTFSMLGTLFGITTPLQLMELAHPDQPLLRRLMQEAPGTYHHSLLVSNLAERAAEMIGADPLLTRVCAYYHDIGKVERPYYFIDNQSGMSNVHDEMDPYASAQIIAEHVRDGIRLGQKNKLPRRVLDAIPQHHGTMLIKYFYYKALEANPETNHADFRYPGPKPQTKENAILMLADGVEATVRAMAQSGALDKLAQEKILSNSDATETFGLYNDRASLSEDAIANVVHKVISERIEDGQLDECDLTVRDIAHIQEAFVSMLKGIYHPRVTYPEKPKAQPAPVAIAANSASSEIRKHKAESTEQNGHSLLPANGPVTSPFTPNLATTEEGQREQRPRSFTA
ncbi:MAG TPA: HDIG domain-containing protein [Chloroflexia bacterium]|nr:HDIG domain-containing protein [Chloroflexia bacterium]